MITLEHSCYDVGVAILIMRTSLSDAPVCLARVVNFGCKNFEKMLKSANDNA
jgi:hypothetical protein